MNCPSIEALELSIIYYFISIQIMTDLMRMLMRVRRMR